MSSSLARLLGVVALAGAVVAASACGVSPAFAASSFGFPPTISPDVGVVGQPASFSITGSGDGANPVRVSYEWLNGQPLSGNPCTASSLQGTSLIDTVPAAGPYSLSAQFTPTQAGTYCLYLESFDGANPSQFAAVPWEADPGSPTLPPGAQQYRFHVVDQRGWPQQAYAKSPFGPMPTDASGDITLTITPAPGAKVEFTRDPAAQSPICNPMESPVDVPLPAPGTTKTVTLANTTGDPFDPGLSDAERGVIGQLNGYRAAHGLAPLAISTSLSSAASAVAHDAAVVKAKAGSYPFPPPFCDAIAQDFDWPGTGVGSLDASTTDPHAAYAHWSDSSARGKQTLNPHWTAAGIGDGGGAWIVIYGACPSGAETRCGMTSDQGDASLYPGAAGTPQVAAPGGGGTPQADGTPQGGGAPQGGQGIAAASGLSLSPRSFAAAPSGPSAVAAGRARGAKVSYTLSAAASVRFTIRRAVAGHRVGTGKPARCVVPKARSSKHRKCSRVVTLPGSFTLPGQAGTNSFRFTGRLGTHELPPGGYTLVATPVVGGQSGGHASAGFRILR